MKKIVFRRINQLIKDGMLLMAANLLREQEEDRGTYEYYRLFALLYMQAFEMAQNIGPLSTSVYRALMFLNFPNLKGGVFKDE